MCYKFLSINRPTLTQIKTKELIIGRLCQELCTQILISYFLFKFSAHECTRIELRLKRKGNECWPYQSHSLAARPMDGNGWQRMTLGDANNDSHLKVSSRHISLYLFLSLHDGPTISQRLWTSFNCWPIQRMKRLKKYYWRDGFPFSVSVADSDPRITLTDSHRLILMAVRERENISSFNSFLSCPDWPTGHHRVAALCWSGQWKIKNKETYCGSYAIAARRRRKLWHIVSVCA